MDAEAQLLEAPSSPPHAAVQSRPSSWSSSGSSGSVEYTSLRDMLPESGPGSCGGGSSFCDHGNGGGGYGIDLDASNINIRNQLLKHAASAYLQSAIVDVAPRDRGCLSRTWRRLLQRRRCRILLRPCGGCTWQECCGGGGAAGGGDPACRCVGECVAGPARRLAAFLAGCFACMWT